MISLAVEFVSEMYHVVGSNVQIEKCLVVSFTMQFNELSLLIQYIHETVITYLAMEYTKLHCMCWFSQPSTNRVAVH